MINQTGVNLGGKLHGFCLSVYCTLMLTSLAVGHSHVRLAQMGGGISDRVQNGALQALSGAANEGFAGTDGTALPAPVATPRPISLNTKISLPELSDVVRSRGLDKTLSANSAAFMGLPQGPFPCKQVDVIISQEKHGLELCMGQGKDYLLFIRNSGDDRWLFSMDGSGQLIKAIHGHVAAGSQEMSPSEGAPLAAAEKNFWLQWAADGGNLASNGQSASGS